MKQPIRILQVVTNLNMGGIENFLVSHYRRMDHEQVQFDFLKHRDTHDYFDDEVKGMGAHIYSVPRLNPLLQPRYDRALRNFLQTHDYKIVHSHLNLYSCFPLKIAKEVGVPVRIAHAHATTKLKFNLRAPVQLYAKWALPHYYTDAFACSQAGGEWMFGGRPFAIWPNAIDTNRFSYNEAVRQEVREKLGVRDAFVIGMVANFSPIKNHPFILRVFSKLCKTEPNARLLLVGDGTKKNEIERLAAQLQITDQVIFTGVRKDTERLLQAMDVFVLPSFTEGFAISVLEAESVGLPCLVSDGVPRDIKLFPEMQTEFLSIENMDAWVSRLLECRDCGKRSWADEIRRTPYDLDNSARQLMHFYLEKYRSLESSI